MINTETKELTNDLVIKGNKLDMSAIEEPQPDMELEIMVRRYLSLMERFSVGIRAHIFDMEIFDRMHGMTTIKMYIALLLYLEKISFDEGLYFYQDFTWLVVQLASARLERIVEGNTKRYSTYSFRKYRVKKAPLVLDDSTAAKVKEYLMELIKQVKGVDAKEYQKALCYCFGDIK